MTTENNVFYYFSTEDKKLRYGDGRLIKEGITHHVGGEIILCENGLHASPTPWDALQYAPGPYLWEVHLSGNVVHEGDKSAANSRYYVRGFNANSLLREFARKQALINIKKIQPYTNKYELIFKYLQTGEEVLRSAAESAAWSAAEYAARSAAWSASLSAAWSAAESAARSAAWSASLSAAWSAAKYAARSAAWSASLSASLYAARSAARSAAWSAARYTFNDKIQAAFSNMPLSMYSAED